MRNNKIKNLPQLQREIAFLKQSYEEKGDILLADTKQYIHQFSILSIIKRYATPSGVIKFDEKTNIVSKLLSMLLPVLVNKTIFRNAGFITKILTAMGANKLGQSLDAQSVSGIFNSVKSLFAKKEKKDKKDIQFADYGIPPDSETY